MDQPWYANDDRSGGRGVSYQMVYMERLGEVGLPRGYFLEPINIILIAWVRNLSAAEATFGPLGMKVVTSDWYLGRFLAWAEKERVSGKTSDWAVSAKILTDVSIRYPQTPFYGLQCSLQAK